MDAARRNATKFQKCDPGPRVHRSPLRKTIDSRPAGQARGLVAYHFIRAFRAHAGQTPHQYLRARRIQRARLPITTPMPVTEICDAVGFQSLGA